MSTRRPRGLPLPDTPTGILLMTYGSAANVEEVPAYLRSVRGGRDADPELVAEFQRRYRLIGWSPLVRITGEQGAELQRLLDATHGGGRYRVEVGMLHSEPRIDEAVARLAVAGARRLVAIVLSPQWSPVIMGGYRRALDAAAWRLGPDAEVILAGPWHRTPAYLDQIAETIDGVVERTGLDRSGWQFAYQSAGHSPEEWLKPDLKDLLPGLRADCHQAVLVVPVQFLADHLEILYDIDIAAREEAEEAGLAFHRIELMNTSPSFIRALADVALTQEHSAQPAS